MTAVEGVDFELAAGALVALIGPNGAGKTTCFNMLSGQLRPDRGTVRLEGRDLVGLPPSEELTNLWDWHARVTARPSASA